jgi:hypothetical protein
VRGLRVLLGQRPWRSLLRFANDYTWVCDGYNDEDTDANPDIDFECAFREVVERDGLNGIKSHQDLTYGSGGWDCFVP